MQLLGVSFSHETWCRLHVTAEHMAGADLSLLLRACMVAGCIITG